MNNRTKFTVQWRRPGEDTIQICRNLNYRVMVWRAQQVIRNCGSVEVLAIIKEGQVEEPHAMKPLQVVDRALEIVREFTSTHRHNSYLITVEHRLMDLREQVLKQDKFASEVDFQFRAKDCDQAWKGDDHK